VTTCQACGRDTDVPTIVRGLRDAPGVVEVCRDCLDLVLRRQRVHAQAPTLNEELETIFEEEAA